MRSGVVIRTAVVAAALLAGLLVPSAAEAAARVSVRNEFGNAEVDPTYATKLTLRGSGFQSLVNGYGGVYVFFGTVKGTWRPSQGGQTGTNYLYVPDSESEDNQGYQTFLAFPGSDTADQAQGTLKADGTFSASITIPGARFNAVDRSGKPTQVDCTKVTCGIITIGAHGRSNARNESFTPVRFKKIYEQAPRTSSDEPTTSATPGAGTAKPRPAGDPTAAVDGDTAVLGRVMSFTGAGFAPGEQVTASFDDGRAAVGPIAAGPSGEVAGVLQLPEGIRAGTHTLRLSGAASGSVVDINFPVRADASAPVVATADTEDDGLPGWAAWVFLGATLVVLAGAAFFAVRRISALRDEQGTAHAS